MKTQDYIDHLEQQRDQNQRAHEQFLRNARRSAINAKHGSGASLFGWKPALAMASVALLASTLVVNNNAVTLDSAALDAASAADLELLANGDVDIELLDDLELMIWLTTEGQASDGANGQING